MRRQVLMAQEPSMEVKMRVGKEEMSKARRDE